jgi:hypothetical protein
VLTQQQLGCPTILVGKELQSFNVIALDAWGNCTSPNQDLQYNILAQCAAMSPSTLSVPVPANGIARVSGKPNIGPCTGGTNICCQPFTRCCGSTLKKLIVLRFVYVWILASGFSYARVYDSMSCGIRRLDCTAGLRAQLGSHVGAAPVHVTLSLEVHAATAAAQAAVDAAGPPEISSWPVQVEVDGTPTTLAVLHNGKELLMKAKALCRK